jgi:hypothetical protein
MPAGRDSQPFWPKADAAHEAKASLRLSSDQRRYCCSELTIGEGLAEEWSCAMRLRQMEAREGGHECKCDSPAAQDIGNRLDGLIAEVDVEQGGVETIVEGDREPGGHRAERPYRLASDVLQDIGYVQSEDDLILDD